MIHFIDPVNKLTQSVDFASEAGINSSQYARMNIYYKMADFLHDHTIATSASKTDFARMIIVIDAIPNIPNSLYSRLELYINYRNGVLMKSCLYKDNLLIQCLEVVEVEELPNGLCLPIKMNKIPALKEGSLIATVRYENLQVNLGLPDSEFDLSEKSNFN
jgi:hypothetical protein